MRLAARAQAIMLLPRWPADILLKRPGTPMRGQILKARKDDDILPKRRAAMGTGRRAAASIRRHIGLSLFAERALFSRILSNTVDRQRAPGIGADVLRHERLFLILSERH